jgi:thiosulfate dehydrogenase
MRRLLLVMCPVVGLMTLGAVEVFADEEDIDAIEASRDWLGGIPAAPTEDWEIGFGGRLYDSWYEALDIDEPDMKHPAYPSAGEADGAATWRCKECHGWDYKGEVGAYGEGSSHFTGIIGVQQMVGADPKRIQDILTDGTHQFTADVIPADAMERLALFVTRGQHDTDFYIDDAKKVRGDAARGERYYQNICAACHGFDGRAIDFSSDPDESEFVGTVASANPWETLHKIRNGQPGQPMPALRVLPMDDIVDILAYAQTLPAK